MNEVIMIKNRVIILFAVFAILMIMVFVGNGFFQNRKLFIAIEDNNYDAAEAAINKGAWVNARKYAFNIKNIVSTNPTPLICACKNGSEEIIKLLLINGADINKKDNFTDDTPLLAILDSGSLNRYSIAMDMINNGADIFAVQAGVASPFYKALYISDKDSEAVIEESVVLIDYLLKNDIEQTIYMSGENALTFSSHYRNWAVVKYLIENKYYDIDSIDSDGNTALIVAVKNNNLKVVKVLLDLGADLSLTDTLEKNALDYALENNHKEIISLLKEREK